MRPHKSIYLATRLRYATELSTVPNSACTECLAFVVFYY